MLTMALGAFAQNITVKGTVLDVTGETLIGATVSQKDKPSNSTATDVNGEFTISVPARSVITIQYIGYQTKEATASQGMVVTLSEDAIALDEVLVVGVGYGQMRKNDLTGAIASVSAKDLKKGLVTSTEQLLQGKVAGLSVQQSSGDPTTGSAIRLRGGTSLSAGNSPLIVVDGIPGVDINTVQPSEIVSMDVLKDASAAAIYGSRGANGVIIVTTNRTTDVERSSIEYTGNVSVGNVARTVDLLSANQWRQYVRDNNIADAIDYGGDTDWLKELQQTAVSHQHNLFMTNSRKSGSTRASLMYQNTEGTIKHNYLERMAANLMMSQYALNNKLKVDIGLNATYDRYNRLEESGFYGVFNYAMNQNPTLPVRDEQGRYTEISGTNTQNPVEILENQSRKRTNLRLMGFGKVEYDIVAGLRAVVNGSYEYYNDQYYSYTPSYAFQNNVNGTGVRQQSDRRVWQTEAYLSYDKAVKEHKFNVMGGYSYRKEVSDGFGAARSGFDTDAFSYNNLGAGTDFRMGDVYSYKEKSQLASFFGRANYSYAGRYMATATLRADGSSRFGENNKWGYFPSASVAWRVGEESFMQPARDWLNNLKLRLGYGVTGNQEIGNYKSLALLGAVGGAYYDSTTGTWKNGFAPSQNANPDLKWETTTSWNLGIDFGLINRLSGTVELYYKKTSDLLWTYPVAQPPYLYSQMLANVGDLVNKGVELTLNANIMQLKDFSWDATLTASYNHQEITKLSNEEFQDVGTPAGALHGISGLSNVYTQYVREGYPVGAFFGPHCEGIDDEGNFILANDGEEQYLGTATPKWNLGLSTTVNYKNFDLGISTYGAFGQKVLNGTAMALALRSRMPGQNITDDYAKSNLRQDKVVYSDYWLENGSFLRLQNITLGYTIPGTQRLGLSKVRFYVSADNLLTLTGYNGIDPEVSTSDLGTSGVLNGPGIDMCNVYPRARTFLLGVNVNF